MLQSREYDDGDNVQQPREHTPDGFRASWAQHEFHLNGAPCGRNFVSVPLESTRFDTHVGGMSGI